MRHRTRVAEGQKKVKRSADTGGTQRQEVLLPPPEDRPHIRYREPRDHETSSAREREGLAFPAFVAGRALNPVSVAKPYAPEVRSSGRDSPVSQPRPSRIAAGSDAHKTLFCRTLLDTFNPYKPAVVDWPKLERDARERLVSLPIWDIAVQTEGRARLNAASYAATVADPLLREAIALNAFEEGRHKEVLANLVKAYGIALAPEPAYPSPRDPEWAFMLTGYSECIDSFFAFGLFESAKRSGFFPPELVDTFEPVMQEEARHILFFVNWAAWHRRTMPLLRRLWFQLRVLAAWIVLLWERLCLASDVGHGAQDHNFTMSGAKSVGDNLRASQVLDLCLAEHQRRMSAYDARLLRPTAVPTLARWVRRLLRA